MKSFVRFLLLLCFVYACINLNAQTAVHNVRPGDTFESIAAKYGIGVAALKEANPYIQGCYVGAELQIPIAKKQTSVPTAVTPAPTVVPSAPKVQTSSNNVAATPPKTAPRYKKEQEVLDPYKLMADAVKLIKSGDYAKAKRILNQSLKIKSLPETYYYRGLCNYRMQKWKSASTDFNIAKSSSKLDEKMKADASELYTFTYGKYQEKVEARRETWAEIGKAVGNALLAVGTVAVGVISETMSGSSYGYGYDYDTGYGSAASFYSPTPAFYSSGISSMSTSQFNNYLNMQLTDLMLISAEQVQQQNFNEYMQATNGGQTMSYDQWMNVKAQAMMSTPAVSTYDIETTGSSQTDYEQRKRDILNTTVGEACIHCKGTGKCPACNGTKVASGLGNTYKCTVCNDNGDCPVCHGTKVNSWNR